MAKVIDNAGVILKAINIRKILLKKINEILRGMPLFIEDLDRLWILAKYIGQFA